MDGQTRDSVKDIGADEYATTTIVRRPLTITDVGPVSGTSGVRSSGQGGLFSNSHLDVNYPNPFNPTTNIEFEVSQKGIAVLRVFNVLGQEIKTLFAGEARPYQKYRIHFDAHGLASGTYFSRLEFGGRELVRQMMFLK
jgi:hypothetical protein